MNTYDFTLCRACMFWQSDSRSDFGHCRRNAPQPCAVSMHVAGWPRTQGRDGCGDGKARETSTGTEATARCGDCGFWRTFIAGLHPVATGRYNRTWWSEAGLCRRYSPSPRSELGERTFWQVCHQDDFCIQNFQPRSETSSRTV